MSCTACETICWVDTANTIECFCCVQFQQEHTVDALTPKDEEGRCRVRKAPERSQATRDPEISEWGNPSRKRDFMLNT